MHTKFRKHASIVYSLLCLVYNSLALGGGAYYIKTTLLATVAQCFLFFYCVVGSCIKLLLHAASSINSTHVHGAVPAFTGKVRYFAFIYIPHKEGKKATNLAHEL